MKKTMDSQLLGIGLSEFFMYACMFMAGACFANGFFWISVMNLAGSFVNGWLLRKLVVQRLTGE